MRHESTKIHGNMFGFRGVEWDQARGKFRARIEPSKYKTRGRWLGSFDTAEDAARAYDEAARECYGEDAYINFPHDGEHIVMRSRKEEGKCPEGHDLFIYGTVNDKRGTILCRRCNAEAARRSRACAMKSS
jgi:hypothetical protein